MHYSCMHTFHFLPFGIICWLVLFYLSVCLSLSLSLSLSLLDSPCMAPKHKTTSSQNPFHSGASSPDSIPLSVRFCDDKACQDFLKNFSKCGIYSELHVILLNFSDTTLPTVIYGRGWESLCEILVSCPSVIIQEFSSNMHSFDYSIPRFITFARGTCIVVTPELISNVLHVSKESHPDYPRCPHLWTVSKDKLLSLFYKTPSSWGDYWNTSCSGFAKGLRFLNMVMTFVLHLLSHYNSITKPHAQFLLSLIKDLTIVFSFHFILSLIDVYKDTTTCDKLIFPSAITRIICHSSVSYPESTHFIVMGAISAVSVRWSKAQLWLKRPQTETVTFPAHSATSTSAPSTSSVGGVMLEVIMVQLQRMDARLNILINETS